MQTITTSAHVLRIAEGLMSERGLPALIDEQAQVVREAIDRWYGVPLQLPSAADVAAYYEQNPRTE